MGKIAGFAKITGISLLLALLAFVMAPVKAADSSALSISPLTFDLTANPGDAVKNQLKIRNVSDTAISISMQAENIASTSESGAVQLTEKDTSYSLLDWISYSPKSFDLKAQETKTIDFTITVPGNAEPGGHYASLLAGTITNSTLSGTGAKISQKVGALILLRVQGTVKFTASVESFNTEKSLYERGNVNFDLRVKNNGTVHIRPKGFINITNMFGRQVATIPLEEKNVFPGAVRKITTAWDAGNRWGRYTATLYAIYGDTNEQLTASTTFTVFPWKVGIPIIAGILLLIAILIVSRRRFARALRVLSGRE